MVRTVIVSVVAFLLLGVYAYLMTKAYKRKCEVVAVQERALATKDAHIALLKNEYSSISIQASVFEYLSTPENTNQASMCLSIVLKHRG